MRSPGPGSNSQAALEVPDLVTPADAPDGTALAPAYMLWLHRNSVSMSAHAFKQGACS